MKSPVVKRSIVIAGHKTSVSLEDAFWKGLKEIAGGRDMTLSELVATIDSDRRHGNLSSAIRLFVLDHYRSMIGEDRTTDRPPARDIMAARPASWAIGQAGYPRMNGHSTPAAADQAAAGVGCRWQEPRPKVGSDAAVQQAVKLVA
jgi:predicted DNA-binding ribbon-helix-helix protein